ncbi:MAG: Uma2 family endonuclease [Lachnospira sp.]|nr:Uma2 family endonuclease [Lachnospira sp.]
MTIQQMKEKKKEMGLSYERIAELSGLPLGTVQKALGGITKVPRQATLLALKKAFQPENSYLKDDSREKLYTQIHETKTAYHYEKKQGEYTLEDYYAIPDDRRVELIDGVIYDMASPTSIHQTLAFKICSAIDRHIEEKNGDCVPFVAPLDVQLDRDDKTLVQPDVIVICNRDQIGRSILGEPDFVVEILSPSTKKIDNIIKVRKYSAAGVKEYWIVDPEKKKVLAYNFMEGDWPTIYSFEDKIPVHIFPEPWELDFSKIYDYVKFMYEKTDISQFSQL